MATMAAPPPPPPMTLSHPPKEEEAIGEVYSKVFEQELSSSIIKDIYASYLGISFAVLISLLPESALSLLPTLKCRNQYLSLRLNQAEEELNQLKSRRQEDSKANARVVEIFASHRSAWQREERRLIQQIDDSSEEIARLRARVLELERNESGLLGEIDELKRELGERDELLDFISRKTASCADAGFGFQDTGVGVSEEGGECFSGGGEECGVFEGEGMEFNARQDPRLRDVIGDAGVVLGHSNGMFNPSFLSSMGAISWAERANSWQDVQFESHESIYRTKHFVARRESPWKLDGESSGIPSKLKCLDQELSNLELITKEEYSNIPSLLRKQAQRYQDLAVKIDDLCQRMRAREPPFEPNTLSSELRTQTQTEFLLEATRLQKRAVETRQELTTVQAEISSLCRAANEAGGHHHGKIAIRRSMESIKSNLREVQRNLEIWLARIIGDLKGILARDVGGSSRVREYYVSRCGYV